MNGEEDVLVPHPTRYPPGTLELSVYLLPSFPFQGKQRKRFVATTVQRETYAFFFFSLTFLFICKHLGDLVTTFRHVQDVLGTG